METKTMGSETTGKKRLLYYSIYKNSVVYSSTNPGQKFVVPEYTLDNLYHICWCADKNFAPVY